jgi:hypothetical protein
MLKVCESQLESLILVYHPCNRKKYYKCGRVCPSVCVRARAACVRVCARVFELVSDTTI